MDAVERNRLMERYRQGPAVLAQAVEGLTDAELDQRPGDGGWGPRWVVHHCADSEMTSAIRLRRLLAEDRPLIQGYDEEEFARRLHYGDRPIGASLAAVRAARESSLQILEVLEEAEWTRTGTHSEGGAYSVEAWLRIYAAHCHDHAEQIKRTREG